MDNKQVFKKYYNRLAKEGIFKSVVLALLAALTLAFAASLISFFFNFNSLWIAIAIVVVVAAALTPVFYFWRYRPNTRAIARRIDRLGLDERLITMLELEKDQSFMAMRQREDAKNKLKDFNEDRLKLKFKQIFLTAPFIVLMAMVLLAGTMTTLSVINSGENRIWGDLNDGANKFAVTYLAEEGGMVYGPSDQIVGFGQSAEMVVAIENEWYMFNGWDDGVMTPERMDLDVREDITVTALFIALTEGESDSVLNGDPDKPNEDADPQPGNTPPDPSDSDDEEDKDSTTPEGDPGDGKKSPGEGQAPNMINNGNDWYGDSVQNQIDNAQKEIAEDRDMPDYLREMTEDYYDYINVSGDETDN